MANLKPALTPDEVKKAGVANIRKAYNNLAETYNKMLDGKLFYCHKCNQYKLSDAFYNDERFASGLYPTCIKCTLDEATDYDKKTDVRSDNREKTKNVFQKMDLFFSDDLYNRCLKIIEEKTGERNRSTAYQQMLVMVKTLPQYANKSWKDSEFVLDGNSDDETINENSRIVKSGKKRFGKNYTADEIYWLENEYQDWIARYSCESKAQENLFKILCQQELERENIRKNGGNTKDIDKSLQDTMNSLGIKPSQSNMEALADNLSFGQLLEQWEKEKPVPEPQGEFKDPDRVGTYIDVFFKGHLAKMMGLRNGFSKLYDKYMEKYTVTKPEINEEEEEALFNQIFGTKLDEDGE